MKQIFSILIDNIDKFTTKNFIKKDYEPIYSYLHGFYIFYLIRKNYKS